MFNGAALGFYVALLAVLTVLWLMIATLGGPVSLQRVDAFTARQVLLVTPENGPLVTRALAVTYRWRRFGLVSGLAFGAATALQQGRLEVNFLAMFLGWFAGAVVAEWRVASPEPGARRRASLTTRTQATYVTSTTRAVLWIALAALAALAAWAGIRTLERGSAAQDWVVSTGECLVGGLVIWAVTRRVLQRARPSDEGLLAADAALRGNSLTVLAGSAVALASFPASAYAAQAMEPGTPPESVVLVTALIMIGGAVLGWWVAARSPSLRAEALASG